MTGFCVFWKKILTDKSYRGKPDWVDDFDSVLSDAFIPVSVREKDILALTNFNNYYLSLIEEASGPGQTLNMSSPSDIWSSRSNCQFS